MTNAYMHDDTTLTRSNAEGITRTYSVKVLHDDAMREPWKEHDGHGPVSEWVTRDKRPGELLLFSDRSSKQFYDLSAAMKQARAEGWGLSEEHAARLAVRLGKPMLNLTQGEITAEAVRRDFEYLRDWCNDVWHWVYIQVTDDETGDYKTLGGLQSDDGEGVSEAAAQLADEMFYDVEQEAREHRAKVRRIADELYKLPDDYARMEYCRVFLDTQASDDARRARDALYTLQAGGECSPVAEWLLSF